MDQDSLNKGISLLQEQINSGKMKFAPGLSVIDSLKKIKYLANGDVDPNSVDGVVKSLIKVTSFFKNREKLKETSLHEIQALYFEVLEKNFREAYHLMTSTKSTPHLVASFFSNKPEIVKQFADNAPELKNLMNLFWQELGPSVEIHLQDLNALKSVYGGDIFPPYNEGIISKTGLYVDTIILPDPFLRGLNFFGTMEPEKATYFLMKHVLSALSIKDIVLTQINPPIAVIARDYVPLDSVTTDFLHAISMKDTLSHLNKAFGLNINTEEELDQFLSHMDNIKSIQNQLKIPDRIVNDLDWKNLPFEEQLKKSDEIKKAMPGFNELSLGQKIKFDAYGRMMQANELIFKANQLHGVPVLDAPTSWQFLLWKYEYDKENSRRVIPEIENTLIVNSLQNNRLSWLGNIPAEALIHLRKEGALSDLRKIFSKDIKEIEMADGKKYDEVVTQIISNINQEFYKHMESLRKISGKSKKFFGYEVAPWLITGGISIAAASTGNIPMSILSTSIGLIGLPSAKDLWIDGKKLLKEHKSIKRSPVGILFDARNKK